MVSAQVAQCQVKMGIPINGHTGCPFSREFIHGGADIHVNMLTQIPIYIHGKYRHPHVKIGILHSGSPNLRKYRHPDPQIHTNMGTPMPGTLAVYVEHI